MKTLDEVLSMMEARLDRPTLEDYIARTWLKPTSTPAGWHFEEIDIARLQLVRHLTQDIEINNEGVDIVLSLLDQLYGLRGHMQMLAQAVEQQPAQVRADIMTIIKHWVVSPEIS